MLKRLVLLLLVGILTGCVSNLEEFSDVIDLEVDGDRQPAVFQSEQGEQEFNDGDTKRVFSWQNCRGEGSVGAFLLIDSGPNDGLNLHCDSGPAQAFLHQKFSVFIAKIPPRGPKDSWNDFGGKRTQLALKAFWQKLAKKEKMIGLWAYGEGSIATAFAAKSLGNVKALIIGGGIYDFEELERHGKLPNLRESIAALKAREGSKYAEFRSIGWDPADLPTINRLYHAENDEVFAAESASLFRDSLSASGANVTIKIVPQVGHKLPEDVHFAVLNRILKEFKARYF